jgi:hypothetical protein
VPALWPKSPTADPLLTPASMIVRHAVLVQRGADETLNG